MFKIIEVYIVSFARFKRRWNFLHILNNVLWNNQVIISNRYHGKNVKDQILNKIIKLGFVCFNWNQIGLKNMHKKYLFVNAVVNGGVSID